MYTLDFTSTSSDLVHSYVEYLGTTHVDIEAIDIMEFLSGNKGAIKCNDPHLVPISNVVVKVLNNIMSYTCFTRLSVEQQETQSTVPRDYKSLIFPAFIISSKKHYVGMKRDGELYTKGMNYIRKSGSKLSSITTEEFVKIARFH